VAGVGVRRLRVSEPGKVPAAGGLARGLVRRRPGPGHRAEAVPVEGRVDDQVPVVILEPGRVADRPGVSGGGQRPRHPQAYREGARTDGRYYRSLEKSASSTARRPRAVTVHIRYAHVAPLWRSPCLRNASRRREPTGTGVAGSRPDAGPAGITA